MDSAATPFLVPLDPPPLKLGLTFCFWAFWVSFSLTTGGFAWGLYQARHSARDLALVGADYYPHYEVLWLLCLALINRLRRDDDHPAGGSARVRLATLAVSLLLSASITLCVMGATPSLAHKVALCVLNGLSFGLAFYFLFRRSRCPCRLLELTLLFSSLSCFIVVWVWSV